MKKLLTVLTTASFALLVCTSAAQAETTFSFTTLAGAAGAVVNSVDGTGRAAQFSAQRGIAVDSTGTRVRQLIAPEFVKPQ
jgi:hypothetical protein